MTVSKRKILRGTLAFFAHARTTLRLGLAGSVFVMASLAPPHAEAQTFPARPIRMVVGFSPGGAPDIIARMIAVRLTEVLGQPIVIDNKPGATGNIAADIVAKSAPDGYTLLLGNVSLAIGASWSPKPPFDPAKDFEPVGMVASLPLILVVNSDNPAKSLSELILIARAKPGTLNYASVGQGSPHHLSGEMLSNLAGAKMVHIPYKGGGQAIQGVLARETDMLFITPLAALPHVRAGKLRALVVTSTSRSAAAPEVPTALEAGLAGFEVDNWHALFAPRNTPQVVLSRLNAVLNQVLGIPELQQQLIAQQGAEAWISTPEKAGAHLRAETAKWANIVKTSGIKLE